MTFRPRPHWARWRAATTLRSAPLSGAAWSVVLAHHSGRADIVFGASFAGRPDGVPGIETMVGPVREQPAHPGARGRADASRGVAPGRARVDGRAHAIPDDARWRAFRDAATCRRGCECSTACSSSRTTSSIRRSDRSARRGCVRSGLPNPCVPSAAGNRPTIRPPFWFVPASSWKSGRRAPASVSAPPRRPPRPTIWSASWPRWPSQRTQPYRRSLPACRRKPVARRGRSGAERPRRRGPRLAPRTEMEKALVGIWRRLFDGEIGTDENYFELGAHSLMLVRAHEQISSHDQARICQSPRYFNTRRCAILPRISRWTAPRPARNGHPRARRISSTPWNGAGARRSKQTA